jgi:transcriptional regulator with XRE-family HTH domain
LEENVEKTMAEIGSKLKEIREYLNITQQFVSEKTGIPRTAISAIESGKRKIDSVELTKLAKLYNHPVSYFLGEEERPLDKTFERLYRAAGNLDDNDRQELLRFAEFLRHSGREKQENQKDTR